MTLPGKRKIFALEEKNKDVRGMVLKQYSTPLESVEFPLDNNLEKEYELSKYAGVERIIKSSLQYGTKYILKLVPKLGDSSVEEIRIGTQDKKQFI